MTKLTLATFLVASSAFAQVVPWTGETAIVPSNLPGDPAVLVIQTASSSLVQLVGTDTTGQAGAPLFSFPNGSLTQQLPVGLCRSADARGNFLAIATPNSGVLLYGASSLSLTALDPASINVPTANQVAIGSLPNGGHEVWVDTSSQELRHFEVSPVVDGGVSVATLPSVFVPEAPSGLALDERTRRLYVAQPNLGIIAVQDGGSQFLLSIDAGTLGTLVGGIDLFLAANGTALLFSASPSTDDVMVHRIAGNTVTFGTALQLGAPDGGAARVRSPKFVDVYAQSLPGRGSGLLLVQDGLGGNYKFVTLDRVSAVFPLPAPYVPGITLPDAGTPATDAGVADGGLSDGGAGGGGGGPGGSTGTPGGAAPGSEPTPTGCGCTDAPFAMLPALLLLWWSRRLRSSPPRS